MKGVCLVSSLRRASSSPVFDSNTEKKTPLEILLSVVSILVTVIKAPEGTSTSRVMIFDSYSLRSSFSFSNRFTPLANIHEFKHEFSRIALDGRAVRH